MRGNEFVHAKKIFVYTPLLKGCGIVKNGGILNKQHNGF